MTLKKPLMKQKKVHQKHVFDMFYEFSMTYLLTKSPKATELWQALSGGASSLTVVVSGSSVGGAVPPLSVTAAVGTLSTVTATPDKDS